MTTHGPTGRCAEESRGASITSMCVGGRPTSSASWSRRPGRHLTHATEDRTRPSFALAAERIARAYPRASRIHLVLDNLNTHAPASLIKAFGAERGHALASRFEFHHTPKHAS
ncbi:transposase [Sorangium sp. So ce367]|uniref:transposase n=1 Tax=Sorangium sp. So ce367 TaxID=3133305 RepID=UPI003F636A69